MGCDVKIEVPAELLTEDERRESMLAKVKEWVGSINQNNLSYQWSDDRKTLTLIYRAEGFSSAGQLAQKAYTFLSSDAELLTPGDWGEYRVSVVIDGTIPSKGERRKSTM